MKPWERPKNKRYILTLDGGGVRGVFSLEILVRMEQLLREHYQKPDFVLADHFDFVAGTSTGAIMATFISWGLPATRIRDLYAAEALRIFTRVPWWRLSTSLYESARLSTFLRKFFVESDGACATLGTSKLRTLLLLVMRNACTGSAWPLSNNPNAKFNAADRSDCNLRLPLWQLVRASTAAPLYFPPEHVKVGNNNFSFIDGGITAYNNPSVIAFLTATLPSFEVEWPTGIDRLHLTSVGTGQARSRVKKDVRRWWSILSYAAVVPAGLMDAVSREQDLLCRTYGECLFGPPIDGEIGDVIGELSPKWEKRFAYTRYNHEFSHDEIIAAERRYGRFDLANVRLVGFLREVGAQYAEKLRIEHLI